MTISSIFKPGGKKTSLRLAPGRLLGAALLAMVGSGWVTAPGFAQPAANEAAEAQVLTRGPVHEAFAGIISFNAQPGIVVPKAPPQAIEEIPPGERPEGENITWIPGYWAWDDERNDFLWVSGIWRALPPGREWRVGYWGETTQGYQWTSGYWADAAIGEITYLPEPPATVEEGPNIEAPSGDYAWTPGNWVWYEERYAWSPGYWAEGRPDWDWTPAHYVWTPRGYVFVEGFWDYSVARRGVLFAPVYFDSGVYSRRGYSYSPSVVIDLALFTDHLFLRPRYDHYYFGDYYAPAYRQSGFHAAFSYQSNRHGYDPIYSHQRWEHRHDRDWGQRMERNYQLRRDDERARPPRTWADLSRLDAGSAETRQHRRMVATSFDQLAKRKDSPLRFQPVTKEDYQQVARRGQDLQKSREHRRALEIKESDVPDRGRRSKPSKVAAVRSPIVAKPGRELKSTGAPPEPQRAPKPTLKPQPDPSKRLPKAEKGQPEPRKDEPDQTGPRKAEPRKAEPRQQEPRKAEPRQQEPRKAEPRKAGPSPKKAPAPAPREKPPQPKDKEKKTPQDPDSKKKAE